MATPTSSSKGYPHWITACLSTNRLGILVLPRLTFSRTGSISSKLELELELDLLEAALTLRLRRVRLFSRWMRTSRYSSSLSGSTSR